MSTKLVKSICTTSLALGISATAIADIAVIVNKNSTIESVEGSELRRLYLGQASSAAGVDMTPLDQQSTSKIHEKFSRSVLRKTSSSLNSYWSRKMFSGKGAPPVQVSGGDLGLISLVKQDSKSIAYIDAAQVTDDVKVVMVIKE